MAIQVMTEVWEYSQASGTRLLILLALADRARKEDAVCWPGVAAIAHQARVTDRDVRHHLVALEASGELRILRRGGQGPKDTSIYQVTVGRYKGATVYTLRQPERVQPGSVKSVQPVTSLEGGPKGEMEPVKGETSTSKRVQPVSAEPITDPSVDPKEPLGAVPADSEPSPDQPPSEYAGPGSAAWEAAKQRLRRGHG